MYICVFVCLSGCFSVWSDCLLIYNHKIHVGGLFFMTFGINIKTF